MSLRRITSVATATAVAFALAAAPAAHADVSIQKDRANDTCTVKLTGDSRAVLLGAYPLLGYSLGKEILGPDKTSELEDKIALLFEKIRADGVDPSSDKALEAWNEANQDEFEKSILPTVEALIEKGLTGEEATAVAISMAALLMETHRGMEFKYSSVGVVDSITVSGVAVRGKDTEESAGGSEVDDSRYAEDYAAAIRPIDYNKLLLNVGITSLRFSTPLKKAAEKVANSYNAATRDLRKVSQKDYIQATKDLDAKTKDCESFFKEKHSGKSQTNDVKKDGQAKGSSEGTSPVLIVVGVLVALAAAAAGAVGAGLIPVPALPGAPK